MTLWFHPPSTVVEAETQRVIWKLTLLEVSDIEDSSTTFAFQAQVRLLVPIFLTDKEQGFV